jgi:hypothetical protein
MRKFRREAVMDIYNLVIGAFLFASPWIFGYTREIVRFDSWAIGAAIIVLSLAAILLFAEWEEWLSALLACWLIASPWVLGFTHTTAMHWSIGLGIAILSLTLLELWMIHYDKPDERLQHQHVESNASDRRWWPK